MASPREINQRISELLECGLPAPPTSDPTRHRQVATYAGDRYRGFSRCAKSLRWLGFADCAVGLDLGCGVGQWCLAFAGFGGHATGVETQPELVGVAEHIAQAVGVGDRVRFLAERIEAADLPAATFDAVWSHSALMFADAELAIKKAAACLVAGGRFNLAYSTGGGRLDTIELGLLGEEPSAVGSQITIMLNGFLHQAGLYHTVAGRVRMLGLGELRRICEAFGLSYVGEPGIQELPGRYRGIPATVDLLTRKTADVEAVEQLLLDRRAVKRAWLADLEELLQSDCPRLVCDVISGVDPELAEESHHDLYARALIRAGRARGAEARRVFEHRRLLPDLTMGLYWHDRARFDEALRCYSRLDRGHKERAFAIGCCLLHLGEHETARQEFRAAVDSGSAELREWIGLVAAYHRAGDVDGARGAYRQFLTTLD
jgi:SAM-dependent methyltransferase